MNQKLVDEAIEQIKIASDFELLIGLALLRELKSQIHLFQLVHARESRCPFDPVASCDLAPGISCAEIDCQVWLSAVGEVNDKQNT